MKTLVRSYWVAPGHDEQDAPDKRIIHGKYFGFSMKQKGIRLGIKLGQGYFKCGSEPAASDWIVDFDVYAWQNGGLDLVLSIRGLEKPEGDAAGWYDIDTETTALFVSVRRSAIDGYWPCYNVVKTSIVLDGINENRVSPPTRKLHRVEGAPDDECLAANGVTAHKASYCIRYETAYYNIGFKLKSAGLNFFSCDGYGNGKVYDNLLDVTSILYAAYQNINDYNAQGMIISSYDNVFNCGYMDYNMDGVTTIDKNTLTYKLIHSYTGQTYRLTFSMYERTIDVAVTRTVDHDIRLFNSSPFRISFQTAKTPLTALGTVEKAGETGRLTAPLTLHLPNYSDIKIKSDGDITFRFDSIRPRTLNTIDIHVGERPTPLGDYILKSGTYEAKFTMTFGYENHIRLLPEATDIIRMAVDKYLLSGIPFRADINSFSNNGNSMCAPLCADVWADICEVIGDGENGVKTYEFLRNTLEQTLLGAPAYAYGNSQCGGNRYEDEYLMTGAALLYGIASYVENTGSYEWFNNFRPQILQVIAGLSRLDIDGDGLIESEIRRGVSGESQWSTNWYDSLSCGYKDALTNALLYGALKRLAKVSDAMGESSLSDNASEWADKIKSCYADTFMTGNGWLAEWKCAEGKLHDYGFLAVNGMAVEAGLIDLSKAKDIMTRLYNALLKTGFDSFDLGLPGNIYEIDVQDMPDCAKALPFGGYLNAGITLSQSRHFINGLYKVGMADEADFILHEISKGLVRGDLVAGIGSGVDWKTWDGTPSGYEGLLSDQFGIFQPLLKRYRMN